MELKHTKGPWHYTINEAEYIEVRQNQIDSFDCEYNPQIGSVHSNIYTNPPMNKESMEANARLISCAPEMLEELIKWNKSFKNTLSYQKYDVNVFELLNSRYIEAKNIIERATGLSIEEVLS